MSVINDGLREFFETNEYLYTDAGNDWFRLRFSGANGDYNLFVLGRESTRQILVATYCPVRVPEDRRSSVADYLNRVNYGLSIGCLEMDPSDGEVRARSTGPVEPDKHPPPDVLRRLFDSSFYLMDNWLPGLLRVAFGAAEPAPAYAVTLAALSPEPAEPAGPETDEESEPDLTTIELEVSRLLGQEPDSESPPGRVA